MQAETERALADLGTRVPSVRTTVEHLSGGQRQAIELCRFVHWGGRLVLLDEPFAALGVQQTRRGLELVQQIKQQGRGDHRDHPQRAARLPGRGPDRGPAPRPGHRHAHDRVDQPRGDRRPDHRRSGRSRAARIGLTGRNDDLRRPHPAAHVRSTQRAFGPARAASSLRASIAGFAEEIVALLDVRAVRKGLGGRLWARRRHRACWLARRPMGKIAGVDPSEEMVKQATARNAAAIGTGAVDLRRGSVESMPFEDGSLRHGARDQLHAGLARCAGGTAGDPARPDRAAVRVALWLHAQRAPTKSPA